MGRAVFVLIGTALTAAFILSYESHPGRTTYVSHPTRPRQQSAPGTSNKISHAGQQRTWKAQHVTAVHQASASKATGATPHVLSETMIAQFAEPPPFSPPPPRDTSHTLAPPPPPALASSEAAVEDDSRRGGGASTPLARCKSMRSQHSVVIGASWGTLPLSGQNLWTDLKCDNVLRGLPTPPTPQPPGRVGGGGGDHFLREYNAHLTASLGARRVQPVRRIRRADPPNGPRLVVAVCACTTSRGIARIARLEQLTLFGIMLPTLVATLTQTPSAVSDVMSLARASGGGDGSAGGAAAGGGNGVGSGVGSDPSSCLLYTSPSPRDS